MVTPKVLTILAGGAVAASAGGAIALSNSGADEASLENAVANKAATLAQFDCDRIADDVNRALSTDGQPLGEAVANGVEDVDSPVDVSAQSEGQATILLGLRHATMVDPMPISHDTTLDGRWTLEDLQGNGEVTATTMTGDSVTFSTNEAGDLVLRPNNAGGEATVVCGDIETAIGMVHVTATDQELADPELQSPADNIPTDLPSEDDVVDSPVDADADVVTPTTDDSTSAEADANADTDAGVSGEAEADAEADEDAEAGVEADAEAEPTTDGEPTPDGLG